jgi:hypothetical protein
LVIGKLLYQVRPADPLTFAAVISLRRGFVGVQDSRDGRRASILWEPDDMSNVFPTVVVRLAGLAK